MKTSNKPEFYILLSPEEKSQFLHLNRDIGNFAIDQIFDNNYLDELQIINFLCQYQASQRVKLKTAFSIFEFAKLTSQAKYNSHPKPTSRSCHPLLKKIS